MTLAMTDETQSNSGWNTGPVPKLYFPEYVREAIYIMIATDFFKKFYEDGLLTYEEYLEFEKEGRRRWTAVIEEGQKKEQEKNE